MRELLYRKISDHLSGDIVSGNLPAGSRIPGVRELAAEWGTSSNTVLKALEELEASGYIRKTRGQGIFVEPKVLWHKTAELPSVLEMFLHDLDLPFNRLIVSAVEKAAADSGYSLTIKSSNIARGTGTDISEGASGIIVPASVSAEEAISKDSADEDISPLIYIGEFNPPSGFNKSYMVADTYGGFVRAVRMLLAAGRERIRYIGASENLEDEPGWNAVRDVLTGTALGFNREYAVAAGGWDAELGCAAMEKLLLSDEFPDAVICANDTLAAGVYKACRTSGLSIPGDVAVIGAGDQDIAALLEPPLTSLKFPAAIMGASAVNFLADIAAGRLDSSATMRARLDMELIIRESVSSDSDDSLPDDETVWL